MDEEKITYNDVKQYERYFTLVPPFLLERFAKRNSNLVAKFESKVESFLSNLNNNQKKMMDIVLNSEIDELQAVMKEAYQKSNKKQYKILANPKYKPFIENNLNQIRNKVR